MKQNVVKQAKKLGQLDQLKEDIINAVKNSKDYRALSLIKASLDVYSVSK